MKLIMKACLCLCILSANAVADEIYVAPHAFVYHTDRSKNLNEDNNLVGFRYSHDVTDSVNGGVIVQDFDNSVNKKTTLLGAFIEKELIDIDKLKMGSGIVGAYQLRKGYNVPFLLNLYAFAEYDFVRVNQMYVPALANRTDEVFITTFELKVKEW